MEKTTAIPPAPIKNSDSIIRGQHHPGTNNPEQNTLGRKNPWRQRLPLILVLATFILPAVAAFLLLKFNGWQKLAQTENGILITTPTQLQTLFNPQNTHQPLIHQQPSWKLVYVSKGQCETPCQLALMQLRQVHKALGVDQGRVEQWLLPLSPPDAQFQTLIKSTFTDLKISDLISTAQMAWFAQTPAYAQQADISQWVWIVDPLGQVVTAYPAYADMQTAILAGKKLLKDLRYLLKLSRVG